MSDIPDWLKAESVIDREWLRGCAIEMMHPTSHSGDNKLGAQIISLLEEDALTKHGNLTAEQSLEIQASAALATRLGAPANTVTIAILKLIVGKEPVGRLLTEMKDAMRGEAM